MGQRVKDSQSGSALLGHWDPNTFLGLKAASYLKGMEGPTQRHEAGVNTGQSVWTRSFRVWPS